MIQLSPDQLELRRTVRSFAKSEVLPGAAERDRSGTEASDVLAKLAHLGALGITIPSSYGGLGLDAVTLATVIEELGYADASVGSAFAGHYLGVESIRRFADQANRERYLPGLASGTIRSAFALTEPDAGSDIGSMTTKATECDDGWRIRGTKTFISSARESTIMVVFAKTAQISALDGISAFIIPSNSPGITYSSPIPKMGCRGEHAYSVTFDDVHAAPEDLLGEVGQGGRLAMNVLNSSRIDAAALCSGVALRALDLAFEYASSRIQFGVPIRDFQAIQLKLGKMDALVETSRVVTFEAARCAARGEDCRRAAAIAKYMASEMCFEVVDAALQIHGGYGYVQEYEVERLFRDSRLFRIYEGTSDIQLLGLYRTMVRTHAGRSARS